MLRIFTILATILTAFAAAGAWNATAGQDSPVGDWRGQSVCQVKPSGCHDEEALYHVKSVSSKPGAFEMQADKIVDGKPVTMGTSPCTWDAEKHLLECPLPNGSVVELKVHGSEMQGAMKMRDGTVWRKISLRKTE